MRVRPVFLILTLFLHACGTRHLYALPDPTAEPDQERQAIRKRLAGIDMTVHTEAWHHRPRRLTEHFLPFLIAIENHSRGEVTLRIADVTLTDDLGRMRRPLWPEEVASLLLGGWDESAIVPSIGFEATGPEPTIFGVELGFGFNRYRALRDIHRFAFPPTPIPAAARGEGFVYFPSHPRDARRVTLHVTLDTPSGRYELPFFFAIVN
jgi:hypothetical protein